MENDESEPYPGSEPNSGSIIFTHYGAFFHTGELALHRLPDLMKMADSLHKEYGGDLNQMLGGICLIISDVPVDPLLNADPERKASVAGIGAASYLLHHPDYEQRARQIIESGKGVMILRIYGKLDVKEDGIGPLEHKVELFDDWDSYQQFVGPIVKEYRRVRPNRMGGEAEGGRSHGGGTEARVMALILSVLFQGEEIKHFTHEYDKGMDKFLPYLYCVLIRREGTQSFVAGMMIMSSISNTQTSEFREMISGLFNSSPPFTELAEKPVRFLPARVKLEGSEPVTVEECLRVMATQFYNHSRPPGNA